MNEYVCKDDVRCDNEFFLDSKEAEVAHEDAGVQLWHILYKSPDLNPVECFWSWLQKNPRDGLCSRHGLDRERANASHEASSGKCTTRVVSTKVRTQMQSTAPPGELAILHAPS